MYFYDRWVLPPILDLVMRQHQLQKYRREVVAAANGRVLEVGVGSGLNFSRYGKQVEIVFGIDPSPRLLADARPRPVSRRISAGVCDRDPFREQYGRHGLDDLDALFDRGPIGRITRDATSPQAGRQAALRRTWAFTRAWNRAMATPTHLSLLKTLNAGKTQGFLWLSEF